MKIIKLLLLPIATLLTLFTFGLLLVISITGWLSEKISNLSPMKTIRLFLFLLYWNIKIALRDLKKKFKLLTDASTTPGMLLIPGVSMNSAKFMLCMICSICGCLGLFLLGKSLFDYYVMASRVNKSDIYFGTLFLIISFCLFILIEVVIKI
jgi:hypothetical protein